MIKSILLIFMLVSTSLYGYNDISNIKVNSSNVKVHGPYITVKVKCNKGNCTIDTNTIKRARLLAIANIKSVKSWARDFENGTAVRYLKTIRVSDTECIITFLICHSADSKMFDNTFGIEILYKDKK